MLNLQLMSTLLIGLFCNSSADVPVELFIVAGQSNAVGYDAKPSELPKDDADQAIMFWWQCGDPPPDQHDSTSGGQWLRLQPQPKANPIKPVNNLPARQYGNFTDPAGGFGPEIGFARARHAQRKRAVAIIKTAWSGTAISTDWKLPERISARPIADTKSLTSSAPNQLTPADTKELASAGPCYRAMIEQVRQAMKQAGEAQPDKSKRTSFEIAGFLWVQGESDANPSDAPKYADRLRQLIQATRQDLSAPRMKALVSVNAQFRGDAKHMDAIVAAQKQAAKLTPMTRYVDGSDLSIANPYHFDSKGTLELGKRFANALAEME